VGIGAVEKNMLLILDTIIITHFDSMSLSQNVGCEHLVTSEINKGCVQP
jgi:hypothetical protein